MPGWRCVLPGAVARGVRADKSVAVAKRASAPPYHHLDRRSSPPDNDAAAKAFSGLLLTLRTPRPRAFTRSFCLDTFTFQDDILVCLLPRGLPSTAKTRKGMMVFTEERFGSEESARRKNPRICLRSRRWLRRGVPGGRRQRRRTPTHFGCLYRQTTTSALQRCAPATREELLLLPRASVLPWVRACAKGAARAC